MFSHIHFQTIGATDLLRARDFYRDRLGFLVERDEPYGDSRWIFMRLPGATTRLHFDRREAIAPQQTPELVLVTADVDATCAELGRRGVPVVAGPDTAPWDPATRWALIHDSEGNLVLIQTVRE